MYHSLCPLMDPLKPIVFLCATRPSLSSPLRDGKMCDDKDWRVGRTDRSDDRKWAVCRIWRENKACFRERRLYELSENTKFAYKYLECQRQFLPVRAIVHRFYRALFLNTGAAQLCWRGAVQMTFLKVTLNRYS